MGKQKTKEKASPFTKAGEDVTRYTCVAYGESGVLKTGAGLAFMPGPICVIDTERSTDAWTPGKELFGAKIPEYDRRRAAGVAEMHDVMEWLRDNKHDYRTLMIDSMTPMWDNAQKMWSDIFLLREQRSKAYKHEYFDLQQKNWGTIKAYWKDLWRTIHALDLNLFITCREKDLYRKRADGKQEVVGRTFDCEKNLQYEVDTVMHFTGWDPTEKNFMAVTTKSDDHNGCKDRHHLYPVGRPFPLTPGVFDMQGIDLTKPVQSKMMAGEQLIAEIRQCMGIMGYTENDLVKACQKREGISDPEDMSEVGAKDMLAGLNEQVKEKRAAQSAQESAPSGSA